VLVVGTDDARLIAAAPELLEACEMWSKYFEDGGLIAYKGKAPTFEMFTALHEAIAKAKGET
jgi:hypothetical protein